MTVTATNRKEQFTTNGVTTEFTFTFAITDTSQVYAYTVLDDVETEYTDFTVIASDDVEGGTLTTNSALSGVDLLIYRDVALTQQVDYESGGRFPADSHEQALDKLTLQNQDQQEELDRALKTSISVGEGYEVEELESGKILAFEDGKIISSDGNYSDLETLGDYTDFIVDWTTTTDVETETPEGEDVRTLAGIQADVDKVIDDVYRFTIDTVADIPSVSPEVLGLRVQWMGYYSVGDGGSNWGVIKQGAHTADGGSIFSINSDYYIEANLTGRVSIKKFGAKMDSNSIGEGTDDTSAIQAALDYTKQIRIPEGSTIVNSSGLSIDSTHDIKGASRELTRIYITPTASTILFDVSLASGSYNTMYLSGVSVIAIGDEIGLSVVRTPQDSDGLDNNHSYCMSDIYTFSDWMKVFDVGDHINGYLKDVDIRGGYLGSSDDSGQVQTIALSLSGASGGFGFQFYKFKVSGYRTSMFVGEGIEAFYMRDGEATSTWYGLYADQVTSKPGGNIQNVHINANKTPIFVNNRRNFQIDNVQLYRSTGFYDHSENWAAINLNTCGRVNVSNVQVRHENMQKSGPNRVGVWLQNSYSITLCGYQAGYVDGLSMGLIVSASTAIKATGIVMESITTNLINITGSCSDVSIDPVTYRGTTLPTVPIQVTAENRVSSNKVSRKSTYIPEVSIKSVVASDLDYSIYPGISANMQVVTDTESTTSYVRGFNLRSENVLYGDEFSFKFTIPSSAKGSFRIVDISSASILETFTGVGTYYATAIFTSLGWVIKSSS